MAIRGQGALSRIAAVTLLGMLSGCSTNMLESKTVDYKSVAKAPTHSLEVPPDLLAPTASDRFIVPDAGTGATTLSELDKAARPVTATERSAVLPQPPDMHIERSGSQRWLVVNRPVETLWLQVKEFWEEMGFIIATESQQTGILETDWAENRAKIPQDVIRRVIGKVIDNLYSTPERDKFRVRFERGSKPGETEIYITHKGTYEVYVENEAMRRAGTTKWQPRPTEPELEAEMLSRLMLKLSNRAPNLPATTEAAAAPRTGAPAPAATSPAPARAVFAKGSDGVAVLNVADEVDRAWRRVGLSLDRLGFTVQDRDRSAGFYDVRYLDPDKESARKRGLARLAFWENDSNKGKAVDYRVVLAKANAGTQIRVLTADGKPDRSETADRILHVLEGDLR